ncbi:MAG: para-aminobenzoate synthetase / 4-amino-4-deoxychorismate lyase [Solirubrobacterales bacterium]|nr:para-aminobenzoate synthetase / 4-amino-4-deoxychorismate lyase [Solirubrobacterales bacterium]
MSRPAGPPDPGRGLYETVLVAAGGPVQLERHLDRLAASVRELFGAELPARLPGDVARAADELELGRLRIDVEPDGAGGLRHTVAATAIDPAAFFADWEHGEALRSVSAAGWWGAHKWSDRGWLEATEAELGAEVPLLVDAEGRVLEAGRANLFVVADGGLATPPADGRILPGTARAATLEIAAELGIDAGERPLTLADLRAADEVFLTSSVKGLRPVRYLDGEELRRGELTERLAAELRRRWLA